MSVTGYLNGGGMVSADQRHTRHNRCPICDGADGDTRHAGKRCCGFTSKDGEYVHCSREEMAGSIDAGNGGLFSHRMHGACNCGQSHGTDVRVGASSNPVATYYDYRDEHGVVRYRINVVGHGKTKKIWQSHPDGAGEWNKGRGGAPRMLYRLPELAAADPVRHVYVCEGERDCDSMAARGYLATTNPEGALKFHYVADEARRVLCNRDVVIVADDDEVGHRHAWQVEAALASAVRSIRVLVPPAPHKDVTDLFEAGGKLADLVSLAVSADASVPPPSSDHSTIAAEPPTDLPTAEHPLRGCPTLARLAIVGRVAIEALAAEPIVYAWDQIVSAGQIVVAAGAPGDGKTTLLFLLVAARANTGEAVSLLGHRVTPAPPGMFVLAFEPEHGPASAARKLLKSCAITGVDPAALDRVILLARSDVRLGTPAWVEARRLFAAGLICDAFVDTLARFAPAEANDEQAQAAIFAELARAIEAAPRAPKPILWLATHSRKDSNGNLDDVSGSAQRTGQADVVLFVRANRDKHKSVTSATVTFPKLREEPDEPLGSIEFSIAKDAKGQPRCVLGAAPRVVADRPLDVRAIELLSKGPLTKTKLREALGINSTTLEELLSALFSSRQLTKRQVVISGTLRDCFELRVEGAS